LKRIIRILIFSSIYCLNSFGQHEFVDLKYISPKPNSEFIMPENNIAFRHGEMIEENSISQSFIEVSNSRGDDIEGSILLAEDNRTVIFKPLHPYYLGETIVVKLKDGLKVQSGKQIAPLQFTFSITQKIILPDRTYATESFQNFPPR